MVLIAPSILSSDFANLEREIRAIAAAGADWVHVDVMDGHFVPNLTIGAPVVQAVKRISPLPLDVHLMISNPLFYVPAFAKAGADWITFHLESDSDVGKTIAAIRESGAKVGLSVKPKTPVEALYPWLDQVDMILVMTVEPGFGGQRFMTEMSAKLDALRSRRDALNLDFKLEADGGISPETAAIAVRAGAEILVAGSAVFDCDNYHTSISALRAAATV